MNSSKGTVNAIDFVSWKEEDILRELQTDGVPVSHVYRFLDRRGSSPLGFDKLHPPSHMYSGFTSWMSDTLFLALAAVFVARFLAFRVGSVAD